MFRIAEAVHAHVLLTGTTPTPPNRKISKTARSTVEQVTWAYAPSPIDLLRQLKEKGSYLLAMELTDESQDVFTAPLPDEVISGQQALVLIPGAEAGGVPAGILDLCHASVHLPMRGRNSSLNVAVALGAVAYVLDHRLSTDKVSK